MKEPEKEELPLSPMTAFCRKWDINENLIMLKITLFVMYGATSSLVPFLTIHMQSVGLTVEEIAIIYLALPLTTFLAPPVTGFLVDKFGHYKPVLFVSLILNAIFHHSLMLIPHMETPGEIPPAYVMRHPHHGKVEVWWSPCPSRECPEKEEINLVVDKCEDHCLLHDPNALHKNFKLRHFVEQSIATKLDHYPAGCSIMFPENTEVPTAITTTTVNPDLHFIIEKKHKPGNHTKPGKADPAIRKKHNMSTAVITRPNKSEDETVFMVLDMHENLMTPVENLGMELPEPEDSSEVTDFRQHFNSEMLIVSGVNFSALLEEDLRCGGRVVATNLTYTKLNELAADCMLQKCTFRAGGPEVCPPDYKESDDRVFWLYFILRFVGTTMMSASVTVMDPIALTLIQEYGGEFGRERLFSTIGMAIFSPVTGLLIDYKSSEQGHTDFSYAFYMYDILLSISVVTVLWMPVAAKMPVDNIMRDMIKLLRLPHIIAFILFMFALGNCWGFIESYLFLHLKELGASNYLLGVTVSVATISSIPFLYGAEKITGHIGHVNVIVLAFFSHAIRLIGYSYIEDPWWVFPFEAMEAIAVHLMWVAAATYCAVIAPKNLLATLIGVLGMAHFSLGRGSGSFIGGFLIGTFGTRQSFRIMGLLGFITGMIYSILYCMWLRKYDFEAKEKSAISTSDDGIENEKLNNEDVEKSEDKLKELEEQAGRLSLIIKFNHRGSLTSLDRMQINKSRRNSSNMELNSRNSVSQIKNVNGDGSTASKVDLLKSALELNHMYRKSNPSVFYKASAPQLNTFYNKDYMEGNLDIPQTHYRSAKTLPSSASLVLTEEIRARSGSIPEEEELTEECSDSNVKNQLNSSVWKINNILEKP